MQKTAYEMRISDWSSDESSSDHVPGLSAGNIVALAFSAWERGVAKIDRVISAVALPPFVHRAIHDIALVNGPRFGDREIDAEQRTPTPFAIFDGFRNDLERHPAETQRLVQRARGVRLGILKLILVGRRTVGEFRQIAFGDPETGLFGFVDHPDEGDLGQYAFLLGIADRKSTRLNSSP